MPSLFPGLAFVSLVTAPTYSAIEAAIHGYTVSLRAVFKDKIEVIELMPPAVQTDMPRRSEEQRAFHADRQDRRPSCSNLSANAHPE